MHAELSAAALAKEVVGPGSDARKHSSTRTHARQHTHAPTDAQDPRLEYRCEGREVVRGGVCGRQANRERAGPRGVRGLERSRAPAPNSAMPASVSACHDLIRYPPPRPFLLPLCLPLSFCGMFRFNHPPVRPSIPPCPRAVRPYLSTHTCTLLTRKDGLHASYHLSQWSCASQWSLVSHVSQ